MSDDGRLVGTIEPAPDGEERPTFTVVKRRDRMPPANVRPCDHNRFTLDHKWSSVTCDDCGERLDPFAVLARFAEWYERFEQRRERMRETEKRMLKTQLRGLRRRRTVTKDEKAAIDDVLDRYWKADVSELRELSERVEKASNDRRWAKRSGSK